MSRTAGIAFASFTLTDFSTPGIVAPLDNHPLHIGELPSHLSSPTQGFDDPQGELGRELDGHVSASCKLDRSPPSGVRRSA